jgi:23S rRNA (guanosine2251-2'-O)-methyltransferase
MDLTLPDLTWALATLEVVQPGQRLAILDPSMLELGPASLVAPGARRSVTVSVYQGTALLPADARLLVTREDDSPGAPPLPSQLELHLRVEAAGALLTKPDGPSSGSEAIAQAALRTALASQGLPLEDVRGLESLQEPTPAVRVYESFVSKDHRPEKLVNSARQAAHHIRFLLREEAAAQATFLRNNDAAVDAERCELPPHALTMVLDNLRSAYNVGSIFRTADTARLAEVVTCGFTPHPPNPKVAKTAFNAIESVRSRHEESTVHAVRSLQAQGITVFAMETTEHSKSYSEVRFPPEGIALVMGNEQTGVDTQVMAAVDGIVEIPTFGLKNSLNVASAAAIVIFEVLRQWGALGTPQPEERD